MQGMTYFEAIYFCYVSLLTIGILTAAASCIWPRIANMVSRIW